MEQPPQLISISKTIKGAELSQMFGKPCIKLDGKAIICYFEKCMVFKLTGDAHKEALSLKGSKLFDPSGKGRAMKEWVQVPATHEKMWGKFAKDVVTYLIGK